MSRDFFNSLPSEIMTDIFLRLPVASIAGSKCVCKPWLHLPRSDEFVKSHLAKSVLGLAVILIGSHKIFELKEGDDVEHQDLHYNELTKFYLPCEAISGSANGLLFLFKGHEVHLVCNPITRDYIKVHFPNKLIRHVYSCYPHTITTYGFGVSKISGQYKVVRISHDSSVIVHGGRRIISESDCHVYTLGTGLWRRVEVEVETRNRFDYSIFGSYVFFNDNLHWVVVDSDEEFWVSCFDLETERFSHFATHVPHREYFWSGFTVLGIACVYLITQIWVRLSTSG